MGKDTVFSKWLTPQIGCSGGMGVGSGGLRVEGWTWEEWGGEYNEVHCQKISNNKNMLGEEERNSSCLQRYIAL